MNSKCAQQKRGLKKLLYFFFYHFRHFATLHRCGIHKIKCYCACTQQLILFVINFAVKNNFMMNRHFFKHGNNRNQIIILCRPQKSCLNFNYRHYNPCCFYIFISNTKAAQSFGSSNFIELRIMAMINNSHLIGKCVVNPYLIFESKQFCNLLMKRKLISSGTIPFQ